MVVFIDTNKNQLLVNADEKKNTMIRACFYINLESRGDIETSQSSRVRESCEKAILPL